MREIIEEKQYTKQLIALGDIKRLDDALRALMWALAQRAENYPVVRGTKRLRVAKTDGYGGGTPRLKIWFYTDEHEGEEHVHLLFVELDPIENA